MSEGTVQELGHIVLYVRDLERSARFYGEVLGWRRLPGPDHLAVAVFSGGRNHHELLLIEVGEHAAPIPAGRRVGLYHFGLKVGDSDDELRAALARLREDGVPIVGMTDHGMTHSIYLLDPDGNELELYVDVPGVSWDDFFSEAMQPRPLEL